MPIVQASYTPGTGRSYVDLTSWAGSFAFPVTPVAGDQIDYPDTISVDATGVETGPDGTYDVYLIQSDGTMYGIIHQVGASTATSAIRSVTYGPGAGWDYVTLIEGFEPDLFVDWTTQPAVGDQIEYQSANLELNNLAQIVALNSEATDIQIGLIQQDGTAYLTTLDASGLQEYDSGLAAPVLASAIPDQTATEGQAFSLDLATYLTGTDVTYSVTGLPAGTGLSLTGSILSGTPVAADLAGSPLSLTATATNATDSASDTFGVTVTASAQAPQGLITFGTASIAATSWSQPYSYDLADATGFQHRINNGNWVESTSPVEMLTADPETAYTLDVRPYNDTDTGSVASVTITTEADTSEPDPGTTVVERVYTITASIDEMPSSQKISMYQGDRVRLNITHNFDMTGKQLKFRIAAKQGQPGKFTLTTEANTMVLTTALSELLNSADRAWQLILRDGESLVVVAEGTVDVRMRIKEGT